ncbi:hypothetical protein HX744_26075 [Pseudonocardia sp. ICBG1122]|nr:hypothetical protein [Pseudonocardia pini]
MADETAFDVDGVGHAAKTVGGLMNARRPAFDALASQRPGLGGFPTAQWLQKVVDDRGTGLVEHADHLAAVLGRIRTTLESVAGDLGHIDAENAAALRGVDEERSAS